MHGNTFEWCLDWYKADITTLGGAVNVTGGTTGSGSVKMRVRRGGSFAIPANYLRSACRLGEPSTSRNQSNGFRVKLGEAISTQ